MKRLTMVVLAAALAVLAACTSLQVELPSGFALLSEGERFLAVSPEGLKFRVRIETNYPEKDVAFWSDALTGQLAEEGYRPRGAGEFFDCPAGHGFFIEWLVPYNGETYTYLTGIVPSGDKLYVAETAAEYTLYETYRESILESLKTISFE